MSLNTIILIVLGAISNVSYAVSLSTYKIHLDQKKRNYDFIIYNQGDYRQRCELSLRPFTLDKTGLSRLLPNGEVPENSADELLRFSPQTFEADIGKPQNVKFKLRIKRGIESHEYRSYLSIKCQDIKSYVKKSTQTAMKVEPLIVQNIPIVARVGRAKYELTFSELAINNNSMSVNFNKTGIYSTYGKLTLINRDSQDVVGKIDLIQMPIEAKSNVITMNFTGDGSDPLQLIYQESENYLQSKTLKININ